MACYLSHTTISCSNAFELSEWWKQLLSCTDIPGDPNEPGHDHCMIIDPETSHRLLFIAASMGQAPADQLRRRVGW